jgi:TonB-linked SusC/RagA family outer membrane protein
MENATNWILNTQSNWKKLTRTVFLMSLLCCCANVQANELEQKLTISGSNISIQKVFQTIKRKTGLTIFYSNELLNDKEVVNIDFKNQTVSKVLDYILHDKNIGYEVKSSNVIALTKLPEKIREETRVVIPQVKEILVTGSVSDSRGEALIGVSIVIRGTTKGTTTDNEGKFSISVNSASDILTFSFVGFKTLDVPVNSKTTITIVLESSLNVLDEAVVIGYGTQKKSDISGAISSIKGNDLNSTPSNTMIQSMQGRASGVDIRVASNAPGGGMRIRIRGTNSINASSQPLYVIDGFPIDNISTSPDAAGNTAQPADPLSSISPNSIASIEILKDASATAIYGARGANGVVIITTKRGTEGKPTVDFDYSLKIARVRKKLDLANAEELAILTNEWATNTNVPLIYDGVNKPLPVKLGEGTDWQDQIFRTAQTHTYNLSVSGGTPTTKYLISGNYLNEDGIIIESNFRRGGLKFNLDQNFGKRIRAGISLNLNRSVNHAIPSDGVGFQNDSPLWNALATTPVIPVVDNSGNYVHNHNETFKILENPVSIAKTRTDITTINRTLGTAFIDFDILKNLVFKVKFGTDLINSKRNTYVPNTAQTQALPNLGIASIGALQSLNTLAEYTLTYSGFIGANNRITAMGGYTYQERKTENALTTVQDFFTNTLSYNNLGIGSNIRPSSSSAVETGLLSYIGRLTFINRDKYIFTGTIRRDGSSKFASSNKWGVFPSAALAWRISKEPFMANISAINDLKLRSSYGLTGNESIGAYSSLALYNTSKPIIGGIPVVGLTPNRIPNPNLKWEKTSQFNVGLDLEAFNGKVTFTAEYYYKKTADLLLNVSIPNQSGYGSSVQNIGVIANKGLEFSLGLNNQFRGVKWTSNVNISFNQNKLLALATGPTKLIFNIGQGETAAFSIAEIGKPLGMFYGYRFDGIWQTKEEIIAAGNKVGGLFNPGMVRYKDLNGDGFKQNTDDREIIGNPNPKFIFGFSNSLMYKNWNLLVFINGSYGNKIANLNRISLLSQPQKHNVMQEYFDQRWRGPGTSNTVEAPISHGAEWNNFSDRDVLDGSYLRFKTMSLSYDFSKNSFGLEWIKRLQLYFATDNLFTITKYSGFDPEVDLYSSSNVQLGVDNGAYPSSKSIRIGIKLGF